MVDPKPVLNVWGLFESEGEPFEDIHYPWVEFYRTGPHSILYATLLTVLLSDYLLFLFLTLEKFSVIICMVDSKYHLAFFRVIFWEGMAHAQKLRLIVTIFRHVQNWRTTRNIVVMILWVIICWLINSLCYVEYTIQCCHFGLQLCVPASLYIAISIWFVIYLIFTITQKTVTSFFQHWFKRCFASSWPRTAMNYGITSKLPKSIQFLAGLCSARERVCITRQTMHAPAE